MKLTQKIVVVLGLYGLLFVAVGKSADEERAIPPIIKRAIDAIKPAADPKKPDEKGEKTEKKEEEIEVTRTPAPPLGPKFIRLHLQDGSVISGDLSVSEITVETQFGKLVVPIDKIRSFSPGLDSNTKAAQDLLDLIGKLGSDDYKTREQAHKDLAAKGPRVQKELEKAIASDNAEVKRHISEILKEFEEAAEEKDDAEESSGESSPWIRLDTIVTSDFTVVGKVSPAEFKIDSKYGPLAIQLADITKGEREVSVRESLKKNLTVDNSNLALRAYKSSGIRVQAGDRVSITAEGSIVMSPWGNNSHSGPEGMPNYGWFIANQIPGGALCAKIGDKGAPFKVGRKSSFIAKSSGTLQLAIGMQAEYSNEGYQFPGEYKIKLKVDPKSSPSGAAAAAATTPEPKTKPDDTPKK